MSHAAPTLVTQAVERARRLAPKLIAFLATGLTASLLIAVATSFGIRIEAPLATMLVGGLSTVAAYIQRDNLLTLAPGQFSLKVIAFVVTSASAAGIIALAQQFGLDLSPHAALIGLVLTALGAIFGFSKADRVLVDLRNVDGVSDVSSLS